MATVLSAPKDLARTIGTSASELRALSSQCRAIQRQQNSLLDDGTPPASVKTQIDALLVPVGASLDAIRAQLDNYVFKTTEVFKPGSPPGVGYLRTGISYTPIISSVDSTQMGHRLINYNDISGNADLFSGLKANDIISIAGSSGNDGRYSLKYDTETKGNGGSTYGLENGDLGSGTGWTAGTNWTISGGYAEYSDNSSTTAYTLTNALTGMTTTRAYLIKFDLTVLGSSPVGTLTVDIAGDYKWYAALSATANPTTYYLITNPGSTTPTITFTATRASGTFTIRIDNVYVYGAQYLVTNEAMAGDVGAGNDEGVVITLEQTAA